jgi:hypothetical protein
MFIHVQKAVETVKKATTEDYNGNYKEAYAHYQLALEYFMTALKCKKSNKTLQLLIKIIRRTKCALKGTYTKTVYGIFRTG